MVALQHACLFPCPLDDITACSDVALISHNAQLPHPALRACADLMLEQIRNESWYEPLFETGAGKMFGVLIVEYLGKAFYLRAFSGMLNGKWQLPGFVPPIGNVQKIANHLTQAERQLADIAAQNNSCALRRSEQSALQYLAQLESAQATTLAQLQTQHRANKIKRAERRAALISENSQAVSQQAERQLLSAESQQDKRERKSQRRYWQERILSARAALDEVHLQQQTMRRRQAMVSAKAQASVFAEYRLADPQGRLTPLTDVFGAQAPPSGAGDCAAPKLLHYANEKRLRCITLMECWVGAPPVAGLRRHGYAYPPCRAKCGPLIPYLTGQNSLTVPHLASAVVTIMYEDEWLAVVEKPAGLLSTPGKKIKSSVFSQCQELYPHATGPLLVHRLDMDTSGLLLIAKDAATHKHLQKQFQNRTVRKTYVAELQASPPKSHGVVSLPIRVDLDDRPRQLVCWQHGRQATTHYRVLSRRTESTRVEFQPISGRTHQLRVHAAHPAGLNAPILGDPLYGQVANRLHLHASRISFQHPASGRMLSFESVVPF